MNNVASGTPNPINTQGIPCCRIFQTKGHWSEECLYLQTIVCTPAILYCKLCRSMGHDEKDCRAYQLLQENMVETYMMKNDEQIQAERAQEQYPQPGGCF